MKILFKFPCRGRANQFFESLDSLHTNIRDRNNYFISLTLDEDDEILNQPEIIERISQYPNVKIEWGVSESKIHAINRSMPDYDFDVIVCWSNDMVATFYGFDDIFREYIYHCANKCGDFDFIIHFPEPDTKEVLNVLYIATRKYFDRFGYVYHPSYKSLWADNEAMLVSQMLGKYHYCGVPGLYLHKNPAYSHYNVQRDELFDYQQGLWPIDEQNFNERKARNFDLHETVNINKFKAK